MAVWLATAYMGLPIEAMNRATPITNSEGPNAFGRREGKWDRVAKKGHVGALGRARKKSPCQSEADATGQHRSSRNHCIGFANLPSWNKTGYRRLPCRLNHGVDASEEQEDRIYQPPT